MATPGTAYRRKAYRPLLAAALVAVWIVGTVVAITASGERGAGSEAELVARATDALRSGDAAAFDEILLDGEDHDFAEQYIARLRAAGVPEVVRDGPGAAEVRSGDVATRLTLTEEGDRWYLSLLPPDRAAR